MFEKRHPHAITRLARPVKDLAEDVTWVGFVFVYAHHCGHELASETLDAQAQQQVVVGLLQLVTAVFKKGGHIGRLWNRNVLEAVVSFDTLRKDRESTRLNSSH